MRIASVNDFFNFVKSNRLEGMAAEASQVVICMDTYGRMCPCDPEEARRAQHNKCKQLYIMFARRAHLYKNPIFSKIKDDVVEFATDGQYMTTISRRS